MASPDAIIDMKDVLKTATLHVRIRRTRQFAWRLWLGVRLIRLAAWIMWLDVEFDDSGITNGGDNA